MVDGSKSHENPVSLEYSVTSETQMTDARQKIYLKGLSGSFDAELFARKFSYFKCTAAGNVWLSAPGGVYDGFC